MKVVIYFIFFLTMSVTGQAQNCIIKNYNVDNGWPSNHISQLFIDPSNKLWIASNSGGYVYDGQKTVSLTSEYNLNRITQMGTDNENKVFVHTDDGIIFHIDIHSLKVSKVKIIDGFDTLANPKVDNIVQPTKVHDNHNSFLSAYTVNYPYDNPNNRLWHLKNILVQQWAIKISSRELVPLNFRQNYWKYTDEKKSLIVKSELPEDVFDQGHFFGDSEDLYCLYKGNIYEVLVRENTLILNILIKNIPLDRHTHLLISGAFNKKTGRVYFGSWTNGLYEVIPSDFDVLTAESIPFPINSFYNQAALSESKILLGNFLVLDSAKSIIRKNVRFPEMFSLSYVDSQNRLWYRDGKDIKIQNQDGNELIFSLNSICSTVAPGTDFNSFYILGKKELWHMVDDKIVSSYSLSTMGLDVKEFGEYIFKTVSNEYYILTNKSIYFIAPEMCHSQKIKSLPEAYYRNMCALNPQLYFIGTYGQGYLIYNGYTWTRMPLDENEHLKFAHIALSDDQGHVWISTNNGLFRTTSINLENYIQGKTDNVFYYYYDKSSGFLTNEFNGGVQSPAIKLKDGRMSFSSMKGLVQFDPLTVPAHFPDGLLNIRSISLNDSKLNSIPQSLSITQGVKDVKIEVGIVYYGHPHNLIVEYKFSGSEEKWKALDQKRFIRLQNLSHGNYTLHIRKRVGFGQDDYQYLAYPIEVLPYFYQTWWFTHL